MITDGPNDAFRVLEERLATISDISSAASVLAWDRQTYMPEGGVGGRAEQLASLARLAHEMLVSPETGNLLERSGEREPDSDEATQEAFGREVISSFGYDWSKGRQDRAVHPFCVDFGGPGDVRITTRFDPGLLSVGLFATCHEAGHALYEQGVDPSYSRTPLASGVSMGVHESQSRLWENLVARSRPFWSHFHPRLLETFPGISAAVEALPDIMPEMERGEFATLLGWLRENVHSHGRNTSQTT